MQKLLTEIRKCQECASNLPLGPNPVLIANPKAKIVIIGQAPGTRVHHSGIPWNDPSGVRLRKWMDIDDHQFYNDPKIAIVPMGFCYPGKGKSGDLPPRPECAPLWHAKLMDKMPEVELLLLIGQYAQRYYLKEKKKKTLTETVMHFEEYLPKYFPTPHPSPRNTFWLRRNSWFEEDVIPEFRKMIKTILDK